MTFFGKITITNGFMTGVFSARLNAFLTFLSHNNVRKHQFLEKYQHFFKNVNIFWQNVDIFTILTVKYLLKDENHEKLLFLM